MKSVEKVENIFSKTSDLRMWLVTLSLILCYFQQCLSDICPARENITPCSCSQIGNGIYAYCSYITSVEQLINSVRAFHGLSIDSFTIADSTFEYIPYNLFENVTIKGVHIAKSNFSRIGNLGEPQFKGLESSLETLTFKNAFTRKYPYAYVSIEHLKQLHTLELQDCHVEVIHNEWFRRGPKSLKIVRFVRGNIRAMGYNAFNALTNLRIIDVSDNELTYIPRWALPEPATFLEELNLERNKLENFPDDIFTDMPNLKKVNLELNEFSTIDEKIWGSVWSHMEFLNIDYNPMICDKNIKWIYNSRDNLEEKLIATCYKPFTLMERDLHSLNPEELK